LWNNPDPSFYYWQRKTIILWRVGSCFEVALGKPQLLKIGVGWHIDQIRYILRQAIKIDIHIGHAPLRTCLLRLRSLLCTLHRQLSPHTLFLRCSCLPHPLSPAPRSQGFVDSQKDYGRHLDPPLGRKHLVEIASARGKGTEDNRIVSEVDSAKSDPLRDQGSW